MEIGGTLRDHLESKWRQSGVCPQQLADAPDLPAGAAHLWEWFKELHLERGSDGMNIGRITARTMLDWQWATGNELLLWERKALRAVDSAWVRMKREATK